VSQAPRWPFDDGKAPAAVRKGELADAMLAVDAMTANAERFARQFAGHDQFSPLKLGLGVPTSETPVGHMSPGQRPGSSPGRFQP